MYQSSFYDRLSQEERRILDSYHERGSIYTVNMCEKRVHERDTTIGDITNHDESFKNTTDLGPARVLPTVIFNDAEDSRDSAPRREFKSPKGILPIKELIHSKDIYPTEEYSTHTYSNRDTESNKQLKYSLETTGKENRTRAKTSARNRPNSSRPRSNSRSTATPKKETPERGSSVKNRSMRRKNTDESFITKGKKLNSSNRNRETGLNLQSVPNVKYEVEKLLRAVFRHSVKCTQFKDDLKKMGGSKLFDEYVRCRETALSWK